MNARKRERALRTALRPGPGLHAAATKAHDSAMLNGATIGLRSREQ